MKTAVMKHPALLLLSTADWQYAAIKSGGGGGLNLLIKKYYS